MYITIIDIILFKSRRFKRCSTKFRFEKMNKNILFAVHDRIFQILKIQQKLIKQLKKTKKNQTRYYNKKHIFKIYQIKKQMLLNSKNLILNKFIKKLNYKYYDSFEINKFIKKQLYKLKFFKIFRSMYNVFHMSLLKSFKKQIEKTSKFIIIKNQKH